MVDAAAPTIPQQGIATLAISTYKEIRYPQFTFRKSRSRARMQGVPLQLYPFFNVSSAPDPELEAEADKLLEHHIPEVSKMVGVIRRSYQRIRETVHDLYYLVINT